MKEIKNIIQNQIVDMKSDGTFKNERIIESPQETEIDVLGKSVINFCANNYLGLSNNDIIKNIRIELV